MSRTLEQLDALIKQIAMGGMVNHDDRQELNDLWIVFKDTREAQLKTIGDLMKLSKEQKDHLGRCEPLAQAYVMMMNAASPHISRYQAAAIRAGIVDGEQMFGEKFIKYVEGLEDALSKVAEDE